MFEYGGVYLDLDSNCMNSLEDYIYENDSFILSEGDQSYSQFLIISEPRHPIMKTTLELAFQRITKDNPRNRLNDGVIYASGPQVFSDAANYFLHQDHGQSNYSVRIVNSENIAYNSQAREIRYNGVCTFKAKGNGFGHRIYYDKKHAYYGEQDQNSKSFLLEE